uniref:hypothetical protein n=1 Tax=Actinoplanes sp. CA-084688 TaxID=3239901 RepID=UPI003F496797
MNGERSLPLHVQKAVVGRALVYQVLDLHQVPLEDAGYGLLWTAVRDRLQTSTAVQLAFDPPGSLGSYLNQLGADLRGALSFFCRDAERACAALLDDIARVLAEAGRAHDELLGTVFTDALEAAADVYYRHGLHDSQDMVKLVSTSFGHLHGSVQSELPIQLAATTYLQDLPEGPSANVDVVINPDLLDELTVFSLPYVMLHECICHVLQGPWQAERVQADAASRFAEGWMDVVAYVVHQAMDNPRRAETAGPGLLDTLRTAARQEAAEKVHRARYAQTRDRAWAQRAMGARAAWSIVALMGRVPEGGSDPSAFVELSVKLNTSSFTNEQRDLFVTGVHKATLQGQADPCLEQQVRTYLKAHDLEYLVHNILRLFT